MPAGAWRLLVARGYAFGDFRLLPAERLLLRSGRAVPLAPRVFDVLVLLARRGGAVVSLDELLATVWNGAFVEPGSVTRTVSLLRQALGDHGRAIETVPKHGYRLAAAIAEVAATEAPVLAVLPFQWLGTAPAAGEHAGLAVADVLAGQLGATAAVRVRATASVVALGDAARDPLAAGSRLGCDLVIEGRLQCCGPAVRATAHAVRVDDRSIAWSITAEAEWPDLFSLQDAVVAAALQRLGAAAPARRRHVRRETRHPEAYRLFLKGRYVLSRYDGAGLAGAIAALQRATELDPGFAAAYATLADLHLVAIGTIGHADAALAAARAAARRAVDLDPELAEGWAAVAVIRFWHDWERAAAAEDYRRAVAADSEQAVVHHVHAWFLMATGRFDEAELALARARRLDPLALPLATDLGMPSYYRGDWQQAAAAYRAVVDLEPAFWYSNYRLGEALVGLGDFEGALRAFATAAAMPGIAAPAQLGIARAHASAGRRDEAVAALAAALALPGPPQHYLAAAAHLACGSPAQALAALRAACETRDKWLGWLLVEPALAPLRRQHDFPLLAAAAGWLPP
jgi:DNA-binding winged helix-turn-helix (wHTH) protein/tetratricopeptide (TPR) repeat protein